ncbi:MAG: hypothetical protein J6Z13_03300 [Clostridia bacterium]|nr:hypothetical protein [Clostridia bacterium]
MTRFIILMLTWLLIDLLAEIVVAQIIPKVRRKTRLDNLKARESKTVAMNFEMRTFFLVSCLFVTLIGVLLIVFPQISAFCKFDYVVTLLVWWLPVIFDLIVLSFMMISIQYDENGFTYRNAFGLKRRFRYQEIEKIVEVRNTVIVTKRKKIVLFNAMSGSFAFSRYLSEIAPDIPRTIKRKKRK